MKLLYGAVLLLVGTFISVDGREICHHDSYIMRGNYCYRYVVSSATYTQATERCERDQWQSSMLYITSAEENNYIWTEMFIGNDETEFWLGLDDKFNEGDFRWLYNNSRPVYKNYSSDIQDRNNDNSDCVKFTKSGWQVQDGFCENSYFPFVCKAPVCDSSDGITCDSQPTATDSGGLSAGIIAAIAIVIIIVICVIVIVIVLGLVWKFNNDLFNRYVCPCGGQGSKQAMMSLQQENQRLRQELNQLKMSSSNRFSTSHFGRDSVSGIPDGMGGMLPALKQGVGVDTFSLNKPPPLSLQHGTSRVAPAMTPSSGGPYFSSPPPNVFTAQNIKSPRQPSVVKPAAASSGLSALPTLKERENEDIISTASEDDTPSPDEKTLPPSNTEDKGQAEPDSENTELKID